jgi:hypothetical protein
MSNSENKILLLNMIFIIHLKDIDDGAVHFCILFIWTLSNWTMDNVQINKIQK